MSLIEISDLTKVTDNGFALEVPSIKLEVNNIYGLIGPNGAGKTTLMKCICGLLNYTGSIEIDNARSKEDILRRVGTNFINSDSMNDFSLNEIFSDHLFYYGLDQKIPINIFFQDVGLKVKNGIKFKELSLGMKQRFLLGLTMLHDPKILLLDEPFNGLDPDGVELFINNLKDLSRGRVVVISSHILKDLESFIDCAIFIDNGKIKKIESMEDIKSSEDQKLFLT